MTASEAWQWMMRAPAERATVPAAGLFWGAAEILRAEHISALHVATPVAVAAAVTYGWGARPGRNRSQEQNDRRARYSRQAAVAMAALGGWAACAAEYGAAGGPCHILAIAYAVGAASGYRWLRRHEVVVAAREWRLAKADWLGRSGKYGLAQTHLLDWKKTWNGEEFLVDVSDTGRRASSWVAGGDLAERIAEVEMLPEGRVRVTRGSIAGRIRISVRYEDPWKNPLPHPSVEPVDGFDMDESCTVRKPVTVGYDPDDGSPLKLTLCDERGAKKILIVAMQGAGKSALLSCIRERVTASADGIVWDLNVAKAREDHAWAPACDLHAIGSAERKKALRILLCARYVIEWRSAQPRDTEDFMPDAVNPLIVIIADEVDELVKGGDMLAAQIKTELTHIATKGRSEGVALIEAGQRGIANWVGGNDIRTQANTVIVGMVNRQSEARHAVGDFPGVLPDMTTYGDGEPGVWCIVTGPRYSTGRSFWLSKPADLHRLAAERAVDEPGLEPGLVAHLGDRYLSLRTAPPVAPWPAPGGHGGGSPDGPLAPARVPSGAATALLEHPEHPEQADTSLEKLDQDLDDALPPDLRAQLGKMRERAAETREIAGELDRALPEADPAKIADAVRQRWDQGAQETGPLPPEIRDQLITMITGGGASGRKIIDAFKPDISGWTTQTYLNRLRFEGVAAVYGKGRGAKWMLVTEAEALGLKPSGTPPGPPPSEGAAE